MKNNLLILLVLILSCNSNNLIDLDLQGKVIIPKTYFIYKTSKPIEIDGKDRESDWGRAIYSDDFIDIEGDKIPKQKTNVKMLWDNEFLYVFAKLYEEHIWGDITKRDAVIFKNNDFEVFINPNDHVFSYGEIEINALGTVWDLFLNKPYRLGGKADSNWNITGIKSAVDINGTINNSNDIDNYWTVELAIPLNEISQLKDPYSIDHTKAGDLWRINFSRVNWDFEFIDGKYSRKKENGKILPEYNWVWSPQGKINMHIPENWGYLIFSDNSLEKQFSYDTDIELEQTLYAIFREIRFGYLKDLMNLNQGTKIEFKPEKLNYKTIYSTFHKTSNGFIIEVENKTSLLKYSIDQSGLINRKNI
ncbi:MAG: carbohydrate-binding family 9-like protein [Flavobacteriaceae bacterium]|nr:carbohydrate-binding family 9-like protein [Flavobacteriaceae bacterium]|tara:strand:- start:7079 stop:8164 length:1086 start_codon:yes stop_codon:yes gene_type:complete